MSIFPDTALAAHDPHQGPRRARHARVIAPDRAQR
jgi:hypothetical protein